MHKNDLQHVVLRAALVCSEALLWMISANDCDYFKASIPPPTALHLMLGCLAAALKEANEPCCFATFLENCVSHL
jgi:hypothetical protein